MANGGNMARKGVRAASISHVKKADAGDELCKPLRPFLAILHVGNSFYSLIEMLYFFAISLNKSILPLFFNSVYIIPISFSLSVT